MNNIKFGGCPFCGNQSCVAGQCQSKSKQEQGELDLDAICQDLQEKTYTQAIRIAELEEALAKQEQGVPEVGFGNIKQEQGEPVAIYQFQNSDGSWIDQAKHSYDYNVKHGHATVRIVYTTPQQRKPLTDEQKIVLGFLDGSNPLQGVWYGDYHPVFGRAKYWWRRFLRQAFANDFDEHGIKE